MESHSPILVGLAFATIVVALTAFGRRLPVPAPVLQVIAGLLVATIPGVAMPTLEPDLVFFVFLPPILWAAAFFTSLREFTANRRPIGLLAIGLVIATTVGVAFVARALFPGMPWAVAVALGAIVSPPDAVAAAAVVSRLPVPRRVIVILEGESLVNDASALVLYRSAVAAAVTGVFSLGESIVRFFLDAGVGILLGLAIGWVLVWALKRTKDEVGGDSAHVGRPVCRSGFSPSKSMCRRSSPALPVGCICGSTIRWWSGHALACNRRPVWDLLVFVLNAMIFVLLGMQFTAMIKATTLAQLPALLAPGLIISLVCVVVRLVWVPVATWAPRLLSKEIARVEAVPRPKAVALVAWTSMRGIVSLATAFALPLTLADGSPFPYRQDLLYITMSVILFTLVVQGCTLAPIIRYFKFAAETHHQQEERFARIEALRRAADALEDAAREGWANDDDVSWLRAELQDRLESHRDPARASTRHALRARMRQAERRMLIRLRNEGAISDEVLRELEHELDLDAMRGDSVLAHPH
ncbi:cation:proton antiporter [Gemmatimonas sp.]|uniref:cation:proton antiporter n=1 Tax=Gemmatimonas sp. TaxID=1962908 RepID=UPI003DA57657